MRDIPFGFVIILLGFFAGALFLALGSFYLKQKRLQRLKHPHKDYYRDRG